MVGTYVAGATHCPANLVQFCSLKYSVFKDIILFACCIKDVLYAELVNITI
jgi:hypothetical protein